MTFPRPQQSGGRAGIQAQSAARQRPGSKSLWYRVCVSQEIRLESMTAEYRPFSKNKNKGQSLSLEEKMKEWVCLIREEKEKESWSLTSDLRGLVSGRKDTFPGWLEGRIEGSANSGERREVHAGTPPQASVFPLYVEGKTRELVFAAEQIFLLPLSRLGSASSLVSSAGLQSNGLELWGRGQLGHPHQMEPE